MAVPAPAPAAPGERREHLDVAGLNVSYDTPGGVIDAVKDVSFTVDRGECVALVGESGSGKSNVCLAIGGFLTAANVRMSCDRMTLGGVALDRSVHRSLIPRFTPGIAIGAETVSASPRGQLNVFFPGALTSTWTGESWTLDKAITVTRIQVQAKTAPVTCSPNAIVRLSDGSTNQDVTISGAANDSGSVTKNYAAGATLTVGVQTAAGGCRTSPADANTVIQYRMQ